MKVRCAKLLDARGNPQERSGWLTIGKVYHVLYVVFDTHGRWLLGLATDVHPGVGLFELKQFEVLTSTIPNTWIIAWNANGVFQLTTKPWNQSGFWESYFDRDPEAICIFEEEKKKIVEADP